MAELQVLLFLSFSDLAHGRGAREHVAPSRKWDSIVLPSSCLIVEVWQRGNWRVLDTVLLFSY